MPWQGDGLNSIYSYTGFNWDIINMSQTAGCIVKVVGDFSLELYRLKFGCNKHEANWLVNLGKGWGK